jgi:predicted negative regulator of RcsB-dependent stress response
MGTLVVLVLVAVAAWVGWKLWKKPDANNDGVVDAKDVVHAAKEVAAEAKVHAEKAAEVAVEKVKKARKPKAPKA